MNEIQKPLQQSPHPKEGYVEHYSIEDINDYLSDPDVVSNIMARLELIIPFEEKGEFMHELYYRCVGRFRYHMSLKQHKNESGSIETQSVEKRQELPRRNIKKAEVKNGIEKHYEFDYSYAKNCISIYITYKKRMYKHQDIDEREELHENELDDLLELNQKVEWIRTKIEKKNDPEMLKYFSALVEHKDLAVDSKCNQKLAELLGWEINEVEAVKKRYFRFIERLLGQNENS